jgi:hypothetical protein
MSASASLLANAGGSHSTTRPSPSTSPRRTSLAASCVSASHTPVKSDLPFPLSQTSALSTKLPASCFSPRVSHGAGFAADDHTHDSGRWLDSPGEEINVVSRPEHAQLVGELHRRVLDYVQLK